MGDDIAQWAEIRGRFQAIAPGEFNHPSITGSTCGKTLVTLNCRGRVRNQFETAAIEAGRAMLWTTARELFGLDAPAADDDDDPLWDEDPLWRQEQKILDQRQDDAGHAERWYRHLLDVSAVCEHAGEARQHLIDGTERIVAFEIRSIADAQDASVRACDRIIHELRAMPAPAAESSVGEGGAAGDGKPERIDTTEMTRLIGAVGDDIAVKAWAVAGDKNLTVDERMTEMLRLDARYVGWSAERWGELLGCTGAAVRKTTIWKRLQEKKRQ